MPWAHPEHATKARLATTLRSRPCPQGRLPHPHQRMSVAVDPSATGASYTCRIALRTSRACAWGARARAFGVWWPRGVIVLYDRPGCVRLLAVTFVTRNSRLGNRLDQGGTTNT
eukprot:4590820-Prymnesium_polylepis.1